MIPARDRANYLGTVLVNPGGPGGSGTELLGVLGQNLSTIVGDKFDVLGFDPRGVGASTPRLDCFGSKAARDIWNTQEGYQLLNASDDALLNFYKARAEVVGDRCARLSSSTEGDIARFMGTASVATGMLKITEKLGQEKVQYWGFVSDRPPPAAYCADTAPSSELRDCFWPIFRRHVPRQSRSGGHRRCLGRQ